MQCKIGRMMEQEASEMVLDTGFRESKSGWLVLSVWKDRSWA
jgi:hypothetical protein